MQSLGNHCRLECPGSRLQKFLQVGYQHVPNELLIEAQTVLGRNEKQLCRIQGCSHRQCDAVGVRSVRLTIATKAERRNHGNDALVEQCLKKFGIDTLDL